MENQEDRIGKILNEHGYAINQRYKATSFVYQVVNNSMEFFVVKFNDLEIPEDLAMIQREFSVAEKLRGLDGVGCFEEFYSRGFMFGGIRPYIDGEELCFFELKKNPKIKKKIFRGLDDIHSCGVAHFDFKCGDLLRMRNVLLDKNSNPYFIDFGGCVLRDEAGSLNFDYECNRDVEKLEKRLGGQLI